MSIVQDRFAFDSFWYFSFNTFVYIYHICTIQSFDYIERLCLTVCKESVLWLHSVASQSEKYHDAIIIQNLAYFEVVVSSRSEYSFLSNISKLLMDCRIRRLEAESHYVQWMVRYEMPDFWGLAERVASVEKRANRDELSLYIRRYWSIFMWMFYF